LNRDKKQNTVVNFCTISTTTMRRFQRPLFISQPSLWVTVSVHRPRLCTALSLHIPPGVKYGPHQKPVGWGEGLHGKIKPNKNNALTLGKVTCWGLKNIATSFLETIFVNSEVLWNPNLWDPNTQNVQTLSHSLPWICWMKLALNRTFRELNTVISVKYNFTI
jgi:hypothetical protein